MHQQTYLPFGIAIALLLPATAWGQPLSTTSDTAPAAVPLAATPDPPPVDLDPALIQSSPVLQRWLQNVPNVLEEMRRDPSFRTRVRVGYSQFPSSQPGGGWHIGVEDVLLGQTGLTLSADYQATFKGQREAWGAEMRYYLLPLGSTVNLAPIVGYRQLNTPQYSTDGLNVGLKLLLVPSRTGAADLSLSQSWIAPGDAEEVGLTSLSFGYAITHQLRLSTDIQWQNARQRQDSRVGVGIEWMF